ncbi:hypothetical protein [Amycolatopsis sp. NPDC004378]
MDAVAGQQQAATRPGRGDVAEGVVVESGHGAGDDVVSSGGQVLEFLWPVSVVLGEALAQLLAFGVVGGEQVRTSVSESYS